MEIYYLMRLEFFGIDKLNFVEFNITGDDLNFNRLNNESRFINSEVFNLFVHCFEKSHDLYEYYEPTKFNVRKIIVLKNELSANLEKLTSIKDVLGFAAFFDGLFLGKKFLAELEKSDHGWQQHWEKHLSLLVNVNKEMIQIIDKCIDETRILWIIGY
jgi:hypothetical protein